MIRGIILVLLIALLACCAMPTRAAWYDRRVSIPAIGLDELIYITPLINRDYAIPAQGVVWLQGTSWIHDAGGRVVLAAHNPGTFSRVPELVIGDIITVKDEMGTATYIVTASHTVSASEWQWLAYTHEPTLLLVTCLGNERKLIEAARQF